MAYTNRMEQHEPGLRPSRALILDRPDDKDLRALVPEAFERFPDGYWRRYPTMFLLIAGSFAWPEANTEFRDFVAELQGRGLRVAEQLGVGTDYQIDLYSSEVLCACYGFQERDPSAGKRPPGFPSARIARQWRNCYAADPRRCNSARVAVARAFDRLASRGLAERRAAGIQLTEAGVAAAKGLMVNRDNNVTSINHYEEVAH